MSEINHTNYSNIKNFKLLNITNRKEQEYFEPIKIGYYFIIFLFIFIINY